MIVRRWISAVLGVDSGETLQLYEGSVGDAAR